MNKLFSAVFVTALSISGVAQAEPVERNLYWGDTHLHTSLSFDVFLFGTPAATAEGAYRFAKGERVTNPTTGDTWRLDRPLDFLVVADHAEMLGNAARIFSGDPELINSKSGKAMIAEGGSGTGKDLLGAYSYLVNTATGAVKDEKHGVTPKDLYSELHAGDSRRPAWKYLTETADAHNDPGTFTAFIGWEWTSHPKGANLHRVVFTSADAKTAFEFLPYSQMESWHPEDLWAWLDKTRSETGADFLSIPHNSNVSNGLMFKLEDSYGNPITADHARQRMEWEKLVEVTQIKGDSETHPILSPTDEFADFESYNFVMLPSGLRPEPVAAEYVRPALKRGLALEQKIGINPYKLGMIGSTDSHTGLSTAQERAFAGKGQKDSHIEDREKPTGLGAAMGWDMGAAGMVAVWAEENTRGSLFAAFKRREVYATTGPRIAVRLFASYDFQPEDAQSTDITGTGYEKGVPMGSDLTAAQDGKAPSFLFHAAKDPLEGNLDRFQIVKGWVDETGQSYEKVFDVAWAGNRQPGTDGKLPTIGSTVNLKTGAYDNSIGEQELVGVWTDPEFDPKRTAFYYARVLQIPTPRYSTLDALALGKDPKETGKPLTIQERAYSSPIWYTP